MVYCSRCGQWNPDDTMYCRSCGSRIFVEWRSPPGQTAPAYGPPAQPVPDADAIKGVVRRFRTIGIIILIIGLASAVASVFLVSYGVEGFDEPLPFDRGTLFGLLGEGAEGMHGMVPPIVCMALFCISIVSSAAGLLEGRLALLGGILLLMGAFLSFGLSYPMDGGFFDDNPILFDGAPPSIFVFLSGMAICIASYPLMAACKIEREHLGGTFLQRMIWRRGISGAEPRRNPPSLFHPYKPVMGSRNHQPQKDGRILYPMPRSGLPLGTPGRKYPWMRMRKEDTPTTGFRSCSSACRRSCPSSPRSTCRSSGASSGKQ